MKTIEEVLMQIKKMVIILANGFEEIEAVGIIDILRRAGVEIQLCSASNEQQVTGAHQITIQTDTPIKSIEPQSLAGIVLPGGLIGTQNMKKTPAVIELVRKIQNANGLIAAICAAPLVLDVAGVLDGKNFTCYPGIEDEILTGHYQNKMVVQDENLITAYGPGATLHFAITLVRHLIDDATADALIDGMLI